MLEVTINYWKQNRMFAGYERKGKKWVSQGGRTRKKWKIPATLDK